MISLSRLTLDQINSKIGTMVRQMMAKLATIEFRSNAFCKLPAPEKCWKAK